MKYGGSMRRNASTSQGHVSRRLRSALQSRRLKRTSSNTMPAATSSLNHGEPITRAMRRAAPGSVGTAQLEPEVFQQALAGGPHPEVRLPITAARLARGEFHPRQAQLVAA